MINPHDNYWIPGEGYTYLSNGEVWSEGIYLGKADSIDNWHDTNEEPPEPYETTDSDKAEAYDILMGTVTWQYQK